MNNHVMTQNLTTRCLAAQLLHEWALRDIIVGIGMQLTVNAPKGALTQEDKEVLNTHKDELIQALQSEWFEAQLAQWHDLSLWCSPQLAPKSIATPWLLPHREIIERALNGFLPSGTFQSERYTLDDVTQAVIDAARIIEAISRITRGRHVPPYMNALLRSQHELLQEVQHWCEGLDSED